MLLAFISDVHSNLEALAAVVKDQENQGTEKVFFLGDAVGYGVNPNQCVKLISSLCEIKLLGNHDYVAMGLESAEQFNHVARESILWTQSNLKRKTIERISNFSMTGCFLDYFMVHATPNNPQDWEYILSTDEAERNFDAFTQSFCMVGHSHLPGIFCQRPDGKVEFIDDTNYKAEPDCRYIINVGSVGQPRDGNPDACYMLLETETNTVEFRRVAYDLEKVQEKMKKAQLPEMLIARLAVGK